MTRYFANVTFNTLEFDAVDAQDAEGMLHQMLDTLGDVRTNISWDNVDWVLYEEGEGH